VSRLLSSLFHHEDAGGVIVYLAPSLRFIDIGMVWGSGHIDRQGVPGQVFLNRTLYLLL